MRMARVVGILVLIAFAAPPRSYGQEGKALTFQQVDSLQRVEQKPVVVFVRTDWCRYCRAMESTTFRDKAVAAWLDSSFYFVSLNAEDQQDIRVRGQTFRYHPTGQGTGQHELAQALGSVDGTVTFPTLCFLNADYEIIYQQPGFVTASQLVEILKTIDDSR